MKDIDLTQWSIDIMSGNEVIKSNPGSPEHNNSNNNSNDESPGKKAHKGEDSQSLNMPKKTTHSQRSSKYHELEKIDEI